MSTSFSSRYEYIGLGASSYEVVVSEHSPEMYVENLVSIAQGCG